MRVLLLGGTTEAGAMAQALAETGVDAVYSYAGRTDAPVAQPLLVRVGGFGGVSGLMAYLRAENITHVVDATHPFAAQMSRNAAAARAQTGVPLLALERAAWQAEAGDRWTRVCDIAGAVAALPQAPARVFLAIGRQHIAAFAARPQHQYLLRLVDPLAELPLQDAVAVIDRGPFDVAGDSALLQHHRITHIVAKNAGGTGAVAKIIAARALGLPVVMIDRPELPERASVNSVSAVMDWLFHADLGV